MDFRYYRTIEWVTNIPLTNAETRHVEVAQPGHTHVTVDVTGRNFLTWGIITELAATLNVLGSLAIGFPVTDTLYSQALVGATYTTPYLLGAPMSNSGCVMITRPFIRIQLVDLALANHAYTRVYVKAW